MSRAEPLHASTEGDLYAVNDDGILTVLRLEDGSKVYRERLGGKFSASPFRVGE